MRQIASSPPALDGGFFVGRDTRRSIMISRSQAEIFHSGGRYFGTQGEAETHEIRSALRPSLGVMVGTALGAAVWICAFLAAGAL